MNKQSSTPTFLMEPSPLTVPSLKTLYKDRLSLFTLKVEKVVNISRPLRGGLGERAQEVPVAFEQTSHEAQEGSLDFPLQACPAATHCLIVCQQEFQGGLLFWSSVSWESIRLRVKVSIHRACPTLFFIQMSPSPKAASDRSCTRNH